MIFSIPQFLFRRPRRYSFSYWNGSRVCRVDPLIAWRTMREQTVCDLSVDLAAADAGDRAAIERVVAMARAMFDLPGPEGKRGLTDRATCSLLTRYFAYMASDRSPLGDDSPQTAAPAAGL